jgi:lysophospholipase L1-like esterase
MKRFERYVAIGDSSTEGLNDPDGHGGYRGWSRRLAARIASVQGELSYTNLGVRGATTREIRTRQFDAALALKPDLVTLFSGTNDVLRWSFHPPDFEDDVEAMQKAFLTTGAQLLTFTLPDLQRVMPAARCIAPRIQTLNDIVRRVSRRTGATLLDLATYPVATDVRLWHEDRIHANALGHTFICDAMAFALELPGSDDSWCRELPPLAPVGIATTLFREVHWAGHFMMPWLLGRIRARLR